MDRKPWKCTQCDRPGSCDICESCPEHCEAKRPNDLAAHRRLDHVNASAAAKNRPN